MTTNVSELIADLDGGTFENRLGAVISKVAGAVIDHGRAGQVQLTLNMKRIGNSYQVQVDHKVAYKHPTSRGTVSEDSMSSTPLHVGKGGALSFFPENQSQMFDKQGNVNKEKL